MQRTLTAILSVFFVLSTCVYGQQNSPALNVTDHASARVNDKADIQHVMESFHQAVVARDGGRVTSPFVAEGSTWFTVLSDEAFAIARAKTATASKVGHSSFAGFSKFVSS
jgi:hypothetical protein